MKHQEILLGAAISMLMSMTSSAVAADARSLALGGSQVSNAYGVTSADANPALLLSERSSSTAHHIRFRADGLARFEENPVDTFDDAEQILDDIESEIDVIANTQVSCNPLIDSAETACLQGTSGLGNLFADTRGLLERIDEQPASGQIESRLGYAATQRDFPFAIDLGFRATGHVTPDVSNDDFGTVDNLSETLVDDSLTIGEIEENANIAFSDTGTSVDINQPEDILTSSASFAVISRVELAFSGARRFEIGQQSVDFGATLRLASIRAGFVEESISGYSEDTDYEQRLRDSEVSETSVNLDLGVATRLPANENITLAASLRRLVSEEVEVENYVFETTPQAVISATYDHALASLSADIALNESKIDNLETQLLSFGVEKAFAVVSLRAGLAHDLAREDNGTSLSLGLGLGAFDFGVQGNSTGANLGLQIHSSF